ncbi:MAG: IS4 family transposase [Chitinophagaceae bacterium]|nr:MAG: IS4 family transposase [Chitinophagaceae bacterium]
MDSDGGLGQNPDFRYGAITRIIKHLEDDAFVERSRQQSGKKSFCRRRKLPFAFLIVLLIQGLQRSLQRDLDRFFQQLQRSDFSVPQFTKGAFSKSRSQLKPTAFAELNEVALQSFYSDAPYKSFEGFRLLAVDSSTLMLPRHSSVVARFGEYGFGPGAASRRSMARTSLLYDACNLTVLHGCIEGLGYQEIHLLERHLPHVRAGQDLVVADRGYASRRLMALLGERGIDFVIRVPVRKWHVVRDFVGEGCMEKTLEVPLKEGGAVALRLVRVELGDGTVEVLATSVAADRLPAACFKELYHLRWGLEEAYKLLKARLCLEAFSGKTALSVEQDFHAALFAVTMTAILCFPVAEKLQQENNKAGRPQKHPRQINRTTALSKVRQSAIGMFLHGLVEKALAALDLIFRQCTEIIRPNRSFKRNKKQPKPPNQYYKQL